MKKKIGILNEETIKSRLRTSIIIYTIAAISVFVGSSFLYMESEADSIQNARWDLHLTRNTGLTEVIMDMHEMTHQKVVADRKWRATPMNHDTIMQLYNFVQSSDSLKDDSYYYPGDQKEFLLDILNRWKNGDFSDIDNEHNELWNMLGGDVGKATGKASKEQEALFILTHFPNKLKFK